MGAGGFLLTMPWTELAEDFIPGLQLEVFNSPKELKEKIKYYLAHEEERLKIANEGRKAALTRDHVNYARRILEVCSH